MSGLLIVANLDGESELAGQAPGATRRTLPRAVLEAISVAGSLMRVFAEDADDLLWTPAPLDPARLAEVPSLARPRLVSGPLDPSMARGRRILAWQETPTVAALRRGAAAAEVPSSADAVARVAHRGFAFELAGRLGELLPGSRLATTPDEALAAARDLGGPWIAKAAFSASGRDRERGDGPPDGDSHALHRRFARLLAHGGGVLVVEPWCDRLWDVGCVATVEVDAGGCDAATIHGIHRLHVDRRGQVVGIELAVSGPGDGGLRADELARLRSVVAETAAALVAAGYRGPFGVDAWRYRDLDGAVRFHALGEINPRLTLGWIGRALVDRLRGPLGWHPGEHVRLSFGRVREGVLDQVLLWAPGEDGRGVWLERFEPRRGS